MKNKCLILCPSWEERSWLGFKDTFENDSFSKVIMVKKSSPFHAELICDTIDKVDAICKENNIACKSLMWEDVPLCDWKSLSELNDELKDYKEIVIEISTMPRDILWSLMTFISELKINAKIIYYQPQSYDNTWLSREPFSPRFLLKYSGIVEFGKPTCLVIVTSFDTERTRQIITKFEPQKVILCVQGGRQFDNEKRNDSESHSKVCEIMRVPEVVVEKINSFSKDFSEEKFKSIFKNLDDFNVVAASFGPKPSAVGMFNAVRTYNRVALCYVPCREYNANYCHGIADKYEIELDLK